MFMLTWCSLFSNPEVSVVCSDLQASEDRPGSSWESTEYVGSIGCASGDRASSDGAGEEGCDDSLGEHFDVWKLLD